MMAVVKIGQVKATLGKAIAYITNPEKTQHGELVSSNFTHTPSDIRLSEKMMVDDLQTTSGGTVLANHVIQSFDPTDPLTPEQAHTIGQEFVEKLTGGEYKYIIATHVDRDHIHNHILICAANETTHKKIRIHRCHRPEGR